MAITATWYFAFVDESETTYNPSVHNRQDTEILGFTFGHAEGEFATLRLITRNPIGDGGSALGLLGPGRPRWMWFSWDIGAGPTALMFGRLIGIPTDVFGPVVTLDFQARPGNFIDQKDALAASLRVLPWYDETFVDEAQRDDNDIVLESRAAVWYVDPVTHTLSISDQLDGEGGTVVFNDGDHIRDGLQLNIGSPPLTAVIVNAEMKWTQRAVGEIDFSRYFLLNWPNRIIASLTLTADSWPKSGTSFGDGWQVTYSLATEPFNFEVKSSSSSFTLTIIWWDGDKTTVSNSSSGSSVDGPTQGVGTIVTQNETNSTYDEGELTSFTSSQAWHSFVVPVHAIGQTTIVGYDAVRPYTEKVSFVLVSDVQPTVTLPGDDDILRLDNLATVDLSELIGGAAPIEDPRRRSYIAYTRGQQALTYLMLLARSHLRSRSRTVNITCTPFINRLGEIKLNKSAQIYDWRIPGGSALGKITTFSCTLTPPTDSSGASVSFSVTIGCAVGNDGDITESTGEAFYVEDGYSDLADFYFWRSDVIITFPGTPGPDMGFTVPPFAPNDDGVDFMTVLQPENVIDVPLHVENPVSEQLAGLPSTGTVVAQPAIPSGPAVTAGDAVSQLVSNYLQKVPTTATFKLKSMKAEFITDVPIVVTDLKIPKRIDLGAA